jgi:mannose-6-phosphate isomerase-like protein (cupin superfamily)
MPVMNNKAGKPDWVKWSNFGFGDVTSAERFDRHFHDADEYWIVYSGKARVLSEGKEFIIGPGDVLCTRMGDEHDILEILEAPLRTFWFEDELKGLKRPGHLHKGDDDPS